MGLTSITGSHRFRDGATYVARETAPLLLVLALPAAIVLALAMGATTPTDPGPAPAATPASGFHFAPIDEGVTRLVDDGAGHRPGDRSFLFEPVREVIAFEPDGSVLLCCRAPGLILGDTAKMEIHRLGDSQALSSWDDHRAHLEDSADMAVAPDGTVWVTGRTLASLDALGWNIWRQSGNGEVIAIGSNGAVWSDSSGKALRILRIRGSRLHDFSPGDGLPLVTRGWDPVITGLATTSDGSVWAGVSARTTRRPGGGLLRFDGERWKVVRPLGRGIDARVEGVAAAADGTLWVYLSRSAKQADDEQRSEAAQRPAAYLARFDGSDWTIFDESDGVPQPGARDQSTPSVLVEAGLDDRVWLTPIARGDCRRLMSFRDGITTDYLDRNICVHDLEIAPDGDAWAIVERSPDRRTDLYVVQP